MSDLVKRLRIKAGMIEMGEMIAWGSDSALMREAADALEMAAPDVQGDPLRYTNDGALAECPCCGSLDVGGAHDTVHCYSCDLTVTKPRPLQNAIAAWNTRAGRSATAPAVQGEPSLVVWVLYDATADKKYIKANDDGALAIFDSEAAARRARAMNQGSDYKRCEYYTAPQPAEQQPTISDEIPARTTFGGPQRFTTAEQQPALDVAGLVKALEKGFPLLSDEGLDEVEHHCEYVIQGERKRVHSILAAHRKGGDAP